jgi:thiamine monophosphate synthase
VAWLGGVRVVLITDRRAMGDGSVVAFGDAVARAVAALPLGSALVQVREKDLDGRALLQRVHAAMASGAPVMVNDRLDVALAAGADGVHLPEDGLAVAEARRLAPDGFWIGRSVHGALGGERFNAGSIGDVRIDKAIEQYLAIVRADPKDVRVWLKIADLYAKKGDTQAAVETYGKVARFYDEEGFTLKAIAVYKQVLKVDASLDYVRHTLAELYRKVGLFDGAEEVLRGTGAPPASAATSSGSSAAHADLVQLGPIFATPGAGKGPPLGVEALRRARATLPAHVRLVAVGGITDAKRAAACRAAGADAVAAIRTAWSGDVAALGAPVH